MNAEVLCYFGLLKNRETLEAILALLPDARREAARAVLENGSGLPEAEVRRKLADLRAAAQAAMRRPRAAIAAGPLSPALRHWMRARLNSHGRENHQG